MKKVSKRLLVFMCVASMIFSTAAQCEPEELQATADLITGTGILVGAIIDGSNGSGDHSGADSGGGSGDDDVWGTV